MNTYVDCYRGIIINIFRCDNDIVGIVFKCVIF